MKALVTGATGFIGFSAAKLLREKGLQVIALVRKGSDASFLASHDIATAEGDVRDLDSVLRALRGCRQLYHLAADYRLWVPDPETMYEINVRGTRNVMEAALRLGTEKVIYTSTVGVLAASRDGKPSDEETPSALSDMTGHYKRSKFIAEKEVFRFIERGLPAVVVNPSTPIGPRDRKPTPTGKMIVDFMNGAMPAYLDTGLNFVDVMDVAAGHWLAAERGKTGQRYILGNRNLSLREFLGILAGLTGGKPPKVRLPYLPVLLAAHIDETLSKFTRRHPRIPLTGVRMARKYMYFDCTKAVRELGMPQSPIEDAIEKAAGWFRESGYVRSHALLPERA
ncbi:MAG: NAD-dependent epimerase/dehydratase family protein [Nitrospirae bacterium]|nr:NAD-dependent epimerase/dehydratase family protein [Nitrospirota bacterium]